MSLFLPQCPAYPDDTPRRLRFAHDRTKRLLDLILRIKHRKQFVTPTKARNKLLANDCRKKVRLPGFLLPENPISKQGYHFVRLYRTKGNLQSEAFRKKTFLQNRCRGNQRTLRHNGNGTTTVIRQGNVHPFGTQDNLRRISPAHRMPSPIFSQGCFWAPPAQFRAD